MRIDLHVHTTCSDGHLSSKEVIDEAVKNDVKIIAIADHDTIEAYNNQLLEYAKNKEIQIIPAVEISTKIEKAGIHVLGYNLDINNKEFKEQLYLIRNSRHDYLHKVGEKLNKLGYYLNVEELDKIDSVTKAHIALDIIKNPKNEQKLIETFGHVPNKGEFIETIMNEGCPAYVKKESVTPKRAAEIIRQTGGKVILAHPVAYVHEDNLTENEILKIVKDMNADGIEANYIYVDRNNIKHDETKEWNEFARKYGLKSTIGSDFHNDDGIRPKIGLPNENIEMSQIEVEALVKWLLSEQD